MDYIFIFLWVAVIIFVGYVSNYLLRKKKVPDPLPLIAIGVIFRHFIGVRDMTNFYSFTFILTHLALLVIMFESGLNLNIYSIIKVVNKAFLSAFSYFLLSSIVTFYAVYMLLGLDPYISLLIGVMLGGVSSTIVIPVINELIKEDTNRDILILDSIFSDIFVIVVSLTLLSTNHFYISIYPLKEIIAQISIGVFIGIISGLILVKMLRKLRQEKYNYMITFASLLVVYSITEVLGGSGAFASLIVGIVLSNAKEILEMLKIGYTYKLKGVVVYLHEEITFFIRTFFFVFLGMSISFSTISYKLVIVSMLLVMLHVLLRLLILRIILGRSEDSIIGGVIVNRGLGAAVVAFLLCKYYGTSIPLIFAGIFIFLSNLFSELLVLGINRNRK